MCMHVCIIYVKLQHKIATCGMSTGARCGTLELSSVSEFQLRAPQVCGTAQEFIEISYSFDLKKSASTKFRRKRYFITYYRVKLLLGVSKLEY